MSDSAGRDVAGSGGEVLLYFLAGVREAVVRAWAGLTAGQQRTPRGAVRDQPAWPHQVPGRGRGALVPAGLAGLGPRHRHVRDRAPGAAGGQVAAVCRQGCARSGEIVRACPGLSAVAAIADPGEAHPVWLRRIVTHMIEETARHAGILRERIGGAAGR